MDIFKIINAASKRVNNYNNYQRVKYHFRKRAKTIMKDLNCKPLSASQKKEAVQYFRELGLKNINTDWHTIYMHFSKNFYKEYIPVELFYNTIEPYLNMQINPYILNDKNLLDKIFPTIEQPEVIAKNINGFYLNNENQPIHNLNVIETNSNEARKIIIKPSIESGGGKNINVFNVENGQTDHNNMSLRDVLMLYGKNFIIQKFFKQHDILLQLNETSVNTLRIQTLLIENTTVVLAAFLRIGGKDAIVDNSSHPISGKKAIVCKINDLGVLNEYGFLTNGKRVMQTHKNILFTNIKVPNYSKILTKIKLLHREIPYFRIISWDIAINRDGNPVLIEINSSHQGIHHQGMTSPLFGEYSEEILSKCSQNMFTYR